MENDEVVFHVDLLFGWYESIITKSRRKLTYISRLYEHNKLVVSSALLLQATLFSFGFFVVHPRACFYQLFVELRRNRFDLFPSVVPFRKDSFDQL